MANKFILKTNDSARAGYLKRAFPVGDATGKVRLGYFIKVSGVETSAVQPGRATIVYAEAGDVPAGVVYKTSLKDQYGRKDDFSSDDDAFYAIGVRETEGLGLVRTIPVLVQKDGVNNYKHFTSVDVAVGVTATVTGGVLTNPAVAGATKVGDKLTVGTVEVFVKAIAGNDVTVVTKEGAAPANITVAAAVVKKGQIGDEVFYNPNQKDAALGNREELPVLTFKTNTADKAIGFIQDVDSYVVEL